MTTRQLIDAGYEAEKRGFPCEALGLKGERQRAAWEQGWRASRHEREAGQSKVARSEMPGSEAPVSQASWMFLLHANRQHIACAYSRAEAEALARKEAAERKVFIQVSEYRVTPLFTVEPPVPGAPRKGVLRAGKEVSPEIARELGLEE